MTISNEKKFGIYYLNALGKRHKEIAEFLRISNSTGYNYLKNIKLVKIFGDYQKIYDKDSLKEKKDYKKKERKLEEIASLLNATKEDLEKLEQKFSEYVCGKIRRH